MIHPKTNIWWGPPKKFTTESEERKISWLELFYDLVYVVVISRSTHNFAEHPGVIPMIDYIFIFSMIFWGWLNGSQYHDLHGSPGIRTRFMTLWQMMAVAVLAVALGSKSDVLLLRATISFAALQIFITYLWWSVGIYDKHHRKLSKPYIICYFTSFLLILSTIIAPAPYTRMIFWTSMLLNYLPPFLMYSKLKRSKEEFSLSSSMVERLGLFTIIVFGEAILGVINGATYLEHITSTQWLIFGTGILIIFELWWIFFALIADRKSIGGYLKGQVTAMLYLPTLASLGMIGATFAGLISGMENNHEMHFIRWIFGTSFALFLLSITIISYFLKYPETYTIEKKLIRRLLLGSGILIAVLSFTMPHLQLEFYLALILLILLAVIVALMKGWIRIQLNLEVKE